MTFELHNFFRSSTSTRLRAALNLKGIGYDYITYVLRDGQTRTPSYLAMNPAGLVPTLRRPDGTVMTQSLAIIEWLEETHPTPAILPEDADGRARVRALAYMIACEIHPLNNLRVLGYLGDRFSASAEHQKGWFTHWVNETFDALERTLDESAMTGRYCHGDSVTLADLCLYAQCWNNRRFDIAIERWPVIARIFGALDDVPALRAAAPPNQPDAA